MTQNKRKGREKGVAMFKKKEENKMRKGVNAVRSKSYIIHLIPHTCTF